MTKITRAIGAVSLLALMSACADPTMAPTTGGTPATAASGLTVIQAACAATQPIAQAAPAQMTNASPGTMSQVQSSLEYYNSACSSLSAMQAVLAANPAGASQSAQWITAVAAGVTVAMPEILKQIH
jgi:hypothetical protein